MTILNEKWPSEFPFPTVIRTVVCCDLDETYIPSAIDKKALGGVDLLESYLVSNAVEKGILAGWVTGTNLDSAWRKSKGYISRSPHFICCSLGTEFYWIRNGILCPSDAWSERIHSSGYSRESVDGIVGMLMEKGMPLRKQPEDYQGPYKISYYYPEGPAMDSDFAFIQALADERRVRVVFTRCNPAAGDPPDCYDVEFIPFAVARIRRFRFSWKKPLSRKKPLSHLGTARMISPCLRRLGKVIWWVMLTRSRLSSTAAVWMMLIATEY